MLKLSAGVLAAMALLVATVAGAQPAAGDPGAGDEPPAPVTTLPPAPPPPPGVPEIANPQYGSGKHGGGIFGTLMDLWDQARNPVLLEDELLGSGRPTPPPGAGPMPALPPGYVSTNAPGSETPSSTTGGDAATGPPLPPGYYSRSGPPPPGYAYDNGVGVIPAPTTTILPPPVP